MSNIAIQGGATGTGTVTLLAPVTSTNRTLTLPDATGTLLISGNGISGTTGTFSGDLSFNSGYGSAVLAYGCRAWVNFNGTGTVAIRASGNVSSITDNGTGDYTVNFTTAMSDANYSKVATASTTPTNVPQGCLVDYSRTSNAVTAPTTSAFRISIVEMSGAYNAVDTTYINAAAFR